MTYADRVQDTTATVGTGSYTLDGVGTTGFRVFGTAFAVGDRVPYAVSAGADFEVGMGTLVSATVLSRDEVFSSSNAGALVNWAAGSKTVWCDLPAKKIYSFGRAVALNRGVLL